MKKLTKGVTTTVKDEDGCVVSETKQTEFYVQNEPDYIKLYIKDVSRLNSLPNYVHIVLNSLMEHVTYSNTLIITAHIRRKIASGGEVSEEGIKKAITVLIEKGILKREARGHYLMDPFIFGKGKWNDIKQIRTTIVYSEKGRTQTNEFSYNE